MIDKPPKYDLRSATRDEVVALFEEHHGYKSLSASVTYCFAVFEDGKPIAAYAWQPPPPGAAKSVCPEAPQGVLSLSRMVAVDKKNRRLKHIGKPLRRQMNHAIDRTRWPVLVTYSDEGEGHNGFVYKCSGWTPTTRNKRPVNVNADGARHSSYSNGKHGKRALTRVGTHMDPALGVSCVCEGRGAGVDDGARMTAHGWTRVVVPGKRWASGKQAHTYARVSSSDNRAPSCEGCQPDKHSPLHAYMVDAP